MRRADFVALLRSAGGEPESVIVVEVQRDREDDKPAAWLEYVAFLYRKHRVPTTLLVLTFDRDVAAWARERRRIGAGVMFRPAVIGPADLPEIATVEQALAHPERAMLAALAHLGARGARKRVAHEDEIVRVFEAILRAEDARLRRIYLSLLHGLAKDQIRSRLEKLMEAYGMGALDIIRAEGKAEGHLEGKAEGRLEGKVEALIAVLKARNLAPDERLEQRLRATRDPELLDRWLARAVVAQSLRALFDA